MSRMTILIFGILSYAVGMGSLTYAMGFIGNLFVPKTIDSGAAVPVASAVAVNLALLGLFAFQHSIMARPAFKAWIKQFIPAAAERSLFVLLSGLALALLYWQWRPIAGEVWSFSHEGIAAAIWALYFLGWVVLVFSSFLISHTDLFGLRQVYQNWAGTPQEAPEFKTPLFYKIVRHPIYSGLLLVFWAAPVMSVGHLLFSAGATGYILIGATLEERDLISVFGDKYRQYRREVSMLIPWPKRSA